MYGKGNIFCTSAYCLPWLLHKQRCNSVWGIKHRNSQKWSTRRKEKAELFPPVWVVLVVVVVVVGGGVVFCFSSKWRSRRHTGKGRKQSWWKRQPTTETASGCAHWGTVSWRHFLAFKASLKWLLLKPNSLKQEKSWNSGEVQSL